MESTLQKPALVVAKTTPKAKTIVYWIGTALFCLQMSFTVYAHLRLPQVAEMFTHLGCPAYFRAELSWAKLLGVALLLAPVPVRLKEWAYAGFVSPEAAGRVRPTQVRQRDTRPGEDPGGTAAAERGGGEFGRGPRASRRRRRSIASASFKSSAPV